jgi:hypothetical protein
VDFFKALRNELGFYVACLNLRERLEAAGAPLWYAQHGHLLGGESPLKEKVV